MTTRIVNKYKERFDVYIGRGSKWGNEFVIEKDNKGKEIPGSRESHKSISRIYYESTGFIETDSC